MRAFLPWLNIPLTPVPNEKGNRRDFHLWSLADAILGADRRKEIQQGTKSYRTAVGTIVAEIQEVLGTPDELVCFGVTVKRNGNYTNVVRVYPLPDDVEPIIPIADEG